MKKSLVALLLAAGMVMADGPIGLIRYKLEYLPEQDKARNNITRAYLGYQGSLNESVSGKIVADVAATDEDGNGKERFAYFLKFAQIDWTLPQKDFAMRMGLLAPSYQTQVNKNWGYLFLIDPVLLGQSTFTGSTGKKVGVFLPSADLGAELSVQMNENLKATFGVLRGDGFKDIGAKPEGDMAHPAGTLQLDIEVGKVMASLGGVVRQHNHVTVNNALEITPNIHIGVKTSDLRAGLEAVARFNRGGSEHDADQLFSAALYSVYSIVPGVEALLRGEYFGSQEDNSSATRGVFGVALLPASKMKLVLHYDLEASVATNLDNKHVVGLASEISF